MTRYQLAQVNVALPREPLDSPLLADFLAALDPINRLADESPGFVWRLQADDGNSTSVVWTPDERLIVNMSVWSSLDSLADFVYRSAHTDVMRQRRKWFETLRLMMALWWIPRDHIPTVAEAAERVTRLGEHGPTPFAFTFRRAFPPPDAPHELGGRDQDRQDRCPAP